MFEEHQTTGNYCRKHYTDALRSLEDEGKLTAEYTDQKQGSLKVEKDEEITKLISDIKAEKAACVPVKLEEVTHIFYHSLVVDEERAFGNGGEKCRRVFIQGRR